MRDNLSIHLNCMNDSFPCSTTNWSPSNIRNGNISTMCATETNNSALVFGLDSALILNRQVVSRSVKTNLLNVSMNASIAREFHTNATSQIAICTTGSSELTSAAILTGIDTTDAATPTDIGTTDAATPTDIGTTDAATPTDIGTTDATRSSGTGMTNADSIGITNAATRTLTDPVTPSTADDVLAGVEDDVLKKVSISR